MRSPAICTLGSWRMIFSAAARVTPSSARAEKDLYSRHSQRILRARQTGELDFHAYAVLSFLVDVIDLPGRDGEAIFTLEGLAEALEWPLVVESLRQKLHELRSRGWIKFESPRRGPGAPWIFRLSGAAIDAERAEFPTSFQPEGPSSWKLIPTARWQPKPQGRSQTAFPSLPNFQRRNPLEQSRAEQSRAEQSRAEQSRAEKSRAEQSRGSR